MTGRRVRLGRITGARGIKGEVRIQSFTADPVDIGAYGPLWDANGGRTFHLRVVGAGKNEVIARIDGITDRDAALALRGVELFVPREALPEPAEEEYYHTDLIGLAVEHAGRLVGRVRAVHEFGAGPILEVQWDDRGVVLLPFTRAAVPMIDLAGGRMVIEPPDGVLEAARQSDSHRGKS